MEQPKKNTHGGARAGAGRKRKYPVGTRQYFVGVTKEAFDRLQKVKNKTEFVSKLILDSGL